MSSLLWPSFFAWISFLGLFVVFWLVQLKTRNASIVDALWASSVGLMSIFWALIANENLARSICVAILAGIWSFRLAGFLFANRVFNQKEDPRYADLRSKWGEHARFHFIWVYLMNASLPPLFGLCFAAVVFNPNPFPNLYDFLGIVVWLLSVGGEALADHQLQQHKKNSSGLCKTGLWKYSRHPNYFFEWLHWFAYPLLAVGSPYFYISLIGPLLMFVFLYFITGIPILEKRSLKKRGQEYKEYQKTTSMFIPWFPKERTE